MTKKKTDTSIADWIFNGKAFSEIPKGVEGFVYLITNTTTGKKYIGRKYFYSIRKVKGKKRRQRTESNWKNYWSSSDILKEDVDKDGKECYKREILVICKTRGDCNRMETYYLWKNNVLEDNNFYNETVGNFRAAPDHMIESRIYGREAEFY